MVKKNYLAVLLLTMAVFFWSGNLIFGRYLHASIPPFGISLWRWGIAFSILVLINIKNFIPFLKILKNHFYQFFLLSLFSIILCSSFQYVGLQYTSATNAGIILSTMPLFITLCSEIILKEKTTMKQKIGMITAFCGALFLITEGKFSHLLKLDFNFGDLILLGTSLMWGIYTSLLKKYKLACTPWELLQAIALIGLSAISIILIAQGKPGIEATFSHLNDKTLGVFFYMGIFASLLALWGWNKGVAILGPSDAGVFMYLMPIFSALLAFGILHEHLHLYHFLGGFIIFTGVYLTVKNAHPSYDK